MSLFRQLKNIPWVKEYENPNQKSKQPKLTGQLTSKVIEQIEREVLGFE